MTSQTGLPRPACSAVILAGGRSRRMGRCKALLPLGGETLLARLVGRLSAFPEVLISANDPALGAGLPARVVADRFPDAGPAGGLHAALTAAKLPFALCVPCDLPNFSAAAAACLLGAFPPDADALVCVDGAGRVHPLCGIYARSALPAIGEQLANRRFRVMELLRRLDCRYLSTAGLLPDSVFYNVNTPQAYRRLLEGARPAEQTIGGNLAWSNGSFQNCPTPGLTSRPSRPAL